MSETVEFVDEVAGIYFRSVMLSHAGDVALQHVHSYDHATLVCRGSAELWANDKRQGIYYAGEAVAVLAGVAHKFVARENNTRLTCVHIGASAEAAKDTQLLQRST